MLSVIVSQHAHIVCQSETEGIPNGLDDKTISSGVRATGVLTWE